MTHVIAVPSVKEQQEMVSRVKENLSVLYHTDVSITVVRQSISTINVWQLINQVQVLAGTYHVIVVPISISLDKLKGFESKTNFNVRPLIRRIDELKQDILLFVNSQKLSGTQQSKEKKDLQDSINRLYGSL